MTETRPVPADGSHAAIDRSSLLAAAYDEYWRLEQQERAVDADAFCARYPAIRSSLSRRLEVHRFLLEHPHLIGAGPARWPEPGETFLRFTLDRLIGQGTFARVFLARQPALGDRPVAVKLTWRGGGEAHTLGRLSHPHVVPIHSVEHDEHTGLTAICMPYLGDATLLNVLDCISRTGAPPRRASVLLDAARHDDAGLSADGLPPPPSTLRHGSYADGISLLAAQLLDALAYLHERGIVHRDLKPPNILLTPAGSPMVLDFNLSADSQRADPEFGGTPRYMAPEQLRAMDGQDGGETIDARSDLFALGVILFELLTGLHPFGPLPLQAATKQVRRQLLERQAAGVPAIRKTCRGIDTRLAALIERCLAFDPGQRPPTARAAAAILRRDAGPVRRTLGRLASRPRLSAALGLAVLLSGITAGLTLPASVGPSEVEQGSLAYQQGRYENAVFHLGQALTADSGNVHGWYVRGLAYQRLGLSDRRYFAHAADFRAAERLDPDGKIQAWLGYCLHWQGQPRAAADLYAQAHTAGFESAALLNDLAAAKLAFGSAAPAKEHLDRCLTLGPLPAAYHNRALAYLQLARAAAQARPAKADGPVPADERVTSLLRAGIADTRAALDCGTPSGELYYDAAQLCAVAARTDPQWVVPSLEYLAQALQYGIEPRMLNDASWSALRREATFLRLKSQAHIPHPAVKAIRILPPTDE